MANPTSDRINNIMIRNTKAMTAITNALTHPRSYMALSTARIPMNPMISPSSGNKRPKIAERNRKAMMATMVAITALPKVAFLFDTIVTDAA